MNFLSPPTSLRINDPADEFRCAGAKVDAVQGDLSTADGVDEVIEAIGGRELDVLCANAGRELGHGFLDRNFADARKVVGTNIVGITGAVEHVYHILGPSA